MIKTQMIGYALCIIIQTACGFGNEAYVSFGGKSSAFGNATVAINDEWSCVNNQGALAFMTDQSIGISYDLRYGLKELSTRTFVFMHPMNGGNVSCQFSAFGSSLFAVYKTGAGYSRLFGEHLGAGMHFDLFSVKMNPRDPALYILTFELGLMWKLAEDFNLGCHVFNLPAMSYKLGSYRERLPVEFRFGFHHSLSSKLNINGEIAGDNTRAPFVRVGVGFSPTTLLTLRLGFQSKGATLGGGFGYQFSKWQLDVGCQIVQKLGKVYGISIGRKL